MYRICLKTEITYWNKTLLCEGFGGQVWGARLGSGKRLGALLLSYFPDSASQNIT